MNCSLSFDRQPCDVIAVPPSTARPELAAEQRRHDEFARRLIAAQDLIVMVRTPGEAIPLPGSLLRWLTELMQPTMK